MINYFSLLIPLLLIYMSKYYIIKHDHKLLIDSHKDLYRQLQQHKMSENEEEQNAIQPKLF